jgi:hypothetical protein
MHDTMPFWHHALYTKGWSVTKGKALGGRSEEVPLSVLPASEIYCLENFRSRRNAFSLVTSFMKV